MIKSLKLIFLIALIIFFGTGCLSRTESTNVKTSGLYPEFYVKKNPKGQIIAEAQILVGGPLGTSLKMVDGEILYCNGVQLVRNYSYLIGTWYTGTVNSSSSYTMRFQRIDEKIDTVLGALPDKPVMDNLDGPVVEGNNIQVKWDVSQPADSVSITISTSKSGTYYSTTISSINDDGNYTITAANLNSILNNAPSGIYTLNVEVIRKKFYPVNPTYKDGIGLTQNSDSKTVKYQKE